MDLTKLAQNIGNFFNQAGQNVQHFVQPIENNIGNAVQGAVHNISQPVQNIEQAASHISIPQVNFNDLAGSFQHAVGQLGQAVGNQPLINNPLPFKFQGPTINQVVQKAAPNSALSAITSGRPQDVIPNIESTVHKAAVDNGLSLDPNNAGNAAFLKKVQGIPLTSQDQQALQKKQSDSLGFGMGFATGVSGSSSNFTKDQLSTVRNGFTTEVRNLVGQFAQAVEQNPNIDRKSLGPLGDYVQSLGETVFGKQAASLTNTQLKNAFDAVMQKADKVKPTNGLSIGLALNNIRQGATKETEALPTTIGEQTTQQIAGKAGLPNDLSQAPSANPETKGFQSVGKILQQREGQFPLQQEAPQSAQFDNSSSNSSIPQSVNGQIPRKFTTSVKDSTEVSPQTKTGVNEMYTPKANTVLTDNSEQLLSQGLDKATNKVLTDLSAEKGKLSDQSVSDAIAVAKAHDAAGNFDQATNIYSNLAQHLTEAGRQVQAASLLANRTPQGLLYSAVKTFQKAGIERTPEIQGQLEGLVNDVKQTTPGSDERSFAVQKLTQFVNNKLPRSLPQATVGIWRAGLLTGPETVAKVAVSHAITTPFELASQIPAALADRAMSLVTGQRSMSATLRGAGSGLVSGTKAMGTKLATGLDAPHSGGFESDFGSNTHQTAYENFIGNLHGSLFKPAYGVRYNTSLNDQALTAARNQGLSGAEASNFVKQFVSHPSPEAVRLATKDAEVATNQQQTQVGKFASQLQGFKVWGLPIGKIITPFTRIPSAIGVNGLWNYTPLGLSKEVVNAVKNGSFDQRTMAQAFGRSATGSTVAALGALLVAHGMMTLKAPSDPKERALWDAQGKQPNSIKVGNNWISLNAFGPVGLTMGIGAGIQNSLQESGNGNMQKAITDGLQSGAGMLLDQPYLKGISGMTKALNDPLRYGQTFVQNTAGSVIPAAVSQIARGSDTNQRMYSNNIPDTFKSEVPGLREGLAPQRDLSGQILPGSNPSGTILGGIAGTINPFYPSQARQDPVSTELQRLYSVGGSSGTPAIAQPNKNQTIVGQKVQLNNQQLSNYIASRGPIIQQKVASLIQDPNYQALSDADKTNAINSVLTAVDKQVKATTPISGPAPVSAPTSGGQSGKYTLVDPNTGTVRTIDISKDVPVPTMTGNSALDKKLTSSYNSALTTRANDIVTLYKNGKIDAPTAEKALEQLNTNKMGGSAKIKKMPAIKSVTAIKAAPLKFSKSPKLSSSTGMKTSKTPTLKIAAGSNAKVSTKAPNTKAVDKQFAKFKVTSPRVYLSMGGSSMRGLRRAAGISVPTRKRKQPILTV